MSDEDFASWQKKLYAWIVVAVVGGNMGTLLNAFNPGIRSDPFTGTAGAALERRVDTLESEVKLCKYQLEKGTSREHEAIRDLERRCSELEHD